MFCRFNQRKYQKKSLIANMKTVLTAAHPAITARYKCTKNVLLHQHVVTAAESSFPPFSSKHSSPGFLWTSDLCVISDCGEGRQYILEKTQTRPSLQRRLRVRNDKIFAGPCVFLYEKACGTVLTDQGRQEKKYMCCHSPSQGYSSTSDPRGLRRLNASSQS